MVTDPLFYRLFEASPETFFLLIGMSPDAARDMAARYTYRAIEFKATSHRTDGVFLPNDPGQQVYFLEVQFYTQANVFAGLLAKAFTYLKQNDAGQKFCGVVLFASRSMEPAAVEPYRALFDSGQIRRFYLDEMTLPADGPLGLSILDLIRESESLAGPKARDLIARTKEEIADDSLRHDLVKLIETVIVAKLPLLSREEIQAMLQIHDIRKSRFYQEVLAEGLAEGEAKMITRVVNSMAAKNMPVEKIAELLEMNVDDVRAILAAAKSN